MTWSWGHLARRGLHAAREQDTRTVTAYAIGRLIRAVGGRPLHYIQKPTLLDFHEISESTTQPSVMAAALGCPETDYWGYVSEFEVRLDKASASGAVPLRYPDLCRSELNTQSVLYALVRAHRPLVALETGIADGFSSFAILSALDENDAGHLYSLDVRSDVGTVVPSGLRGRWTIHVVDLRELERSTKQTLAALADVGFYYHDSGHSYLWQAFEYAAVAPKMTAGGIFLSDDADWSYAFIDHCQAGGLNPVVMLDRRKVIGGYVTPA